MKAFGSAENVWKENKALIKSITGINKNAVSENSDIVLSGYGTDTHSKIEEKLYPKSFDMTFYRKLLIGGYNVEEEWKYFIQNGGMWNKIYKKELLFIFKNNPILNKIGKNNKYI